MGGKSERAEEMEGIKGRSRGGCWQVSSSGELTGKVVSRHDTLHLTVEEAGQDETPSGFGPLSSIVLATLGGVILHRSC